MKRMTTLIGATAPLAILAAVGAAPNAYAQATVPCVQNAGADGVLGTPDDPENTLECGLGAEASAPGATAYGSGAKAPGNEAMRSEEHTSELQSLMRHSSAVFCLKK